MMGKVVSINISKNKGEKKSPIRSAQLINDFGIENDAHAGSKRQISLLALESIQKMRDDLKPGDFAENITTEGIDLMALPIGTHLKIGANAVIKISEKGKVCHAPCAIFKTHGTCVMPTEGIFAEIISEGKIQVGDRIVLR